MSSERGDLTDGPLQIADPDRRRPAGSALPEVQDTVVACSVVSAQPGDVVWQQLCNAPTQGAMAPLDATAQALLPGGSAANPIYPGPYSVTAFGAGLDADGVKPPAYY